MRQALSTEVSASESKMLYMSVCGALRVENPQKLAFNWFLFLKERNRLMSSDAICAFVCLPVPISTFEPFDLFSQNLVYVL
jgi:hypothetical protein